MKLIKMDLIVKRNPIDTKILAQYIEANDKIAFRDTELCCHARGVKLNADQLVKPDAMTKRFVTQINEELQ